MKYAIPLKTNDPKTFHSLIVSQTSYRVVTAPTYLSGEIDDILLEVIEDKMPEIPFKDNAPAWHAKIGEVPSENTMYDANKWFFENNAYDEQKRLVPKTGRPTSGPHFETGSYEKLEQLMQGIINWHENIVKHNPDLGSYKITVKSPVVANGDMSVDVDPASDSKSIALMLARLALQENHFYGVEWTLKDESSRPYLETSWVASGITMVFTKNEDQAVSDSLGCKVKNWAANHGIMLPKATQNKKNECT